METKLSTTCSEYIFQLIQPVFDGGIFSILKMKNVIVHITQSSTYIDLAKQLANKSFYNISIMILIIWSFILFIVAIVLLIRTCCKKLKCCVKCQKGAKNLTDAIVRERFNRKLPTICCSSAKRKSRFVQKNCVTNAMFLTVIFLMIGFMVGIYYSVRNSTDFQKLLKKSNSSYTISNSVNIAINEINTFFTRGIHEANASTIAILDSFNSFVSKLVVNAIDEMTQKVLWAIGITEIFILGKETIANVSHIIDIMTYISQEGHVLFGEMNTFLGEVGTFKSNLRYGLQKECNSPNNSEIHRKCSKFLPKLNLLIGDINQWKIGVRDMTSIISVMAITGFSLSQISMAIDYKEWQIKSLVTSVHSGVYKNFNIKKDLESIPAIWTTIDNTIKSSVTIHLHNFQRSDTVQPYLDLILRIWIPIFDCVLTILVCLLVASLATGALAIFIYFYSRAQKSGSRKEWYKMNLENLFNNSVNEAYPKHISALKEKAVPGAPHIQKVLFTFHFLLGIAIIVPCLFVSISYIAGGLLTTELCRYMVEAKGVAMVDSMVNPLIDQEWQTLKSSLNLSSFIFPIDLKQPQNPVKALYSGCARENATILRELEMTGLFNASAFTDLKFYKDMLKTGETFVLKAVKSADLATLIPISIKTFIDQGLLFSQKFIEVNQHESSISELRKSILKLNTVQYAAFVNELELFLKSIPDSRTAVAMSGYFMTQMKKSVVRYNSLDLRRQELLKNFLALHNSPAISKGLVKLKASLISTEDNLRNFTFIEMIIRNKYSELEKLITLKFTQKLSQSLSQLENSLFPCYGLTSAFTTVTNSICGNTRTAEIHYTIALSITVLWGQLLFCFSWYILSGLGSKIDITDNNSYYRISLSSF